MIDEPEFSVVLTTYSRPIWLAEAIASVLTQTVDDFELIVVDDASDPPAIVPPDQRVRLVRLDENVGVPGARNIGLDTARGRAVTLLDDDDLYTPERLALARRGLARAPVAICWTRYLGEPVGDNRVIDGDVSDTILDDITPSFGTIAVRRDLMVPFDERWQAVEDIDWWLRASQLLEVATVPEVGLIIRRHDLPRWRNDLQTRVQENFDLIDAHRVYFDAHRRAASFRLKRAGLLAMQNGDRRRARVAFARSLWREPRPRTAWHLLRSLRPGRATNSSAAPAR